MLIAGAGGHGIELLDVLEQSGYEKPIAFFDDVIERESKLVFKKYPILFNVSEAKDWLRINNSFCLGVGKSYARKLLAEKLQKAGGKLVSVISKDARIGKHQVQFGDGLNIMTGAIITEDVTIGKGCLIHIYCSIHHNVQIGEYCELSPGCRILGNVQVGNEVSVGSNAVILPGLVIGDFAIIGAGAVVTKNVASLVTVTGVPAKKIIKRD
jgi:sugar O-acyltransferase (sialic acid O-acetyltransferase NeuD family)